MTTKRSGNLPFSNPVGDSLELMKKMWGFAGLPGIPTPGNLASMAARVPQQLPNMFAPTLDVNELEKRIADLRAVEQWLELNAGILRTTIQSLEVQRATIATLKGISGAMLAPMHGPIRGVAEAALQPAARSCIGTCRNESRRVDVHEDRSSVGSGRERTEEVEPAHEPAIRHAISCNRGAAEPDRLVEHIAGSVHAARHCGRRHRRQRPQSRARNLRSAANAQLPDRLLDDR